MAHLIKRLKKGYNLKIKLPLIYFSFGKIGHYVAKCPLKDDNDDEEPKKRVFKRGGSKNKNSFSKQDSDVSDEEELYEKREIMLMAFSNEVVESEQEERIEHMGDLEEKFIITLE